MELNLDAQHGLSGLLTGVVVLLSLHLVASLGKFIFGLLKKKDEFTDQQITKISLALTQNTDAVKELRIHLGMLERDIADLAKIKIDTNNLFSAVKFIAGPKWAAISKAIKADISLENEQPRRQK